ncbi:MAG: hypothetical protein K6T85_18140 [Gorillibacterium sp.]|nr:hypothetical protein [Gorillibacterium sp.]
MESIARLTQREIIKNRENRIKLDMLCSIARSERALARLLEQAADCGAVTESTNERMMLRLAAIARCQTGLLYYVSGVKLRHIQRGTPGSVWLSNNLRQVKGLRGVVKHQN